MAPLNEIFVNWSEEIISSTFHSCFFVKNYPVVPHSIVKNSIFDQRDDNDRSRSTSKRNYCTERCTWKNKKRTNVNVQFIMVLISLQVRGHNANMRENLCKGWRAIRFPRHKGLSAFSPLDQYSIQWRSRRVAISFRATASTSFLCLEICASLR